MRAGNLGSVAAEPIAVGAQMQVVRDCKYTHVKDCDMVAIEMMTKASVPDPGSRPTCRRAPSSSISTSPFACPRS